MYSETDAGCQLVPEPDSDDGKDDRVVLMSMPGIFMVWSDSWACVPGLEKSETKKANAKRLKTRLNTCVLPWGCKTDSASNPECFTHSGQQAWRRSSLNSLRNTAGRANGRRDLMSDYRECKAQRINRRVINRQPGKDQRLERSTRLHQSGAMAGLATVKAYRRRSWNFVRMPVTSGRMRGRGR